MKQWTRASITVVLAFVLAGLSWAAEYTIDPAHSKVLFKVKHLGISSVTGRFKKFSGSYDFDQKKPGVAKATAKIDTASIDTDVEKRDTHLRSADFLDVQKYPEIAFVSKEVKENGNGKLKIVGDLTIHGVTRPVVLDAELGGVVKDPGGNERSAFTASTVINRKDFGLTWNKALETGGLLVGEEVQISLEVEGVRKKDKS
jgi:polyisoprenoid-binding protein YceI